MKKMIVAALMAVSIIPAQAQKGLQGKWFVTSQLGFQQTKDGTDKNTNFSVLPIVGNFIKPDVAVGVAVGLVSIKAEKSSGTISNSNLIVAEPLVRKYYNVAGNFYFFGQLAAPIITGKEKESDLKISQAGLALSGGTDIIIGKHFSVEFSYNLINASVTTIKPVSGDKTTITDISLAHVASADPIYNQALKGSSPTLTSPLSFGFKFLF